MRAKRVVSTVVVFDILFAFRAKRTPDITVETTKRSEIDLLNQSCVRFLI